MRGASAIQKTLDENPAHDVRVFAVWQSILPSDWARPGPGILGRIKDPRARQFWDPKNIFPKLLGERLKGSSHPQPQCCFDADDTPWDLVAVYPAGVRWEKTLPQASFIDGPVVSVRPALRKALDATAKK